MIIVLVTRKELQVLLSQLGLARQVMGQQEGRELAECKAMLKEITLELAQAHSQQQELEADRDKSEASLLEQLQNSSKDLALAQKDLMLAEEQIRTLSRTLNSVRGEFETQKRAYEREKEEYFESQKKAHELEIDSLKANTKTQIQTLMKKLESTQEDFETQGKAYVLEIESLKASSKIQALMQSLESSQKDFETQKQGYVMEIDDLKAMSEAQNQTLQSTKAAYVMVIDKLEAKMAAAENENAKLKEEVEYTRNTKQKMEKVKRGLDTKLQTVWLLASKGAGQAIDMQEESSENTGQRHLGEPLTQVLTVPAIAETAKKQESDDDLKSCESSNSIVVGTDSTPTTNNSAMQCTTPHAKIGRGQQAFVQMPSSPSSIVDGLQRHIKDLMHCIHVRDAQVRRII